MNTYRLPRLRTLITTGRRALVWSSAAACLGAGSGFAQIVPGVAEPAVPAGEKKPHRDPWLDRLHDGLFRIVWRTGMSVDRLAGSRYGEEPYQDASGSVAVALLWSEFEGWDPKLRFHVDMPLPRLNERFHLFLGRVDPDEYVTERDAPSGALPRRRSSMDRDETLAGLVYATPLQGHGRFGASAGARLRSPLDTYVKGYYSYERQPWEGVRLRVKETLFWRRSEGFGLTSAIDLQRAFGEDWLLYWTASGTISEKHEDLRGYMTLTLAHSFWDGRAISGRLLFEGEANAPVPVREYGVQVAYRTRVIRDWLALEVRTDLTWPKEHPHQPRKPSWGFGLGFEMYFGREQFSWQPVTF